MSGDRAPSTGSREGPSCLFQLWGLQATLAASLCRNTPSEACPAPPPMFMGSPDKEVPPRLNHRGTSPSLSLTSTAQGRVFKAPAADAMPGARPPCSPSLTSPCSAGAAGCPSHPPPLEQQAGLSQTGRPVAQQFPFDRTVKEKRPAGAVNTGRCSCKHHSGRLGAWPPRRTGSKPTGPGCSKAAGERFLRLHSGANRA